MQFDPQILAALTGAGVGGLIAIVAGIVGAIIQYRLSIRLEKMRFEQQKELAEAAAKQQRNLTELEVMRQRDLAEFQIKKQAEEADRKRKQDQEDREKDGLRKALLGEGYSPETLVNVLPREGRRFRENLERDSLLKTLESKDEIADSSLADPELTKATDRNARLIRIENAVLKLDPKRLDKAIQGAQEDLYYLFEDGMDLKEKIGHLKAEKWDLDLQITEAHTELELTRKHLEFEKTVFEEDIKQLKEESARLRSLSEPDQKT